MWLSDLCVDRQSEFGAAAYRPLKRAKQFQGLQRCWGVRRERLLLGRSAAVVVVKEGRGRRGSERLRGIYNLRSLE